jgi:hypothetical protein
MKIFSLRTKVKYAYQEWPHPVNTDSPHCQKVERRREHDYTMINFKIDVTALKGRLVLP